MLEIIEQAIKPHDQFQFEIKLDYELLENRDTQYRVATYIFIPHSLGISRENYPKHYFYRDVQNYIRLKTPATGLSELSEGGKMPLANLGKIVSADNWAQKSKKKQQVISNCKLLSAMLKSTLREHIGLIEKRIDEAPEEADMQFLIANLVEEFITRTKDIVEQYRDLYAAFNLPQVEAEVFNAYALTDESVSLLIEEAGIEIFQVVKMYFAGEARETFSQELRELIEREMEYRRMRGYGSVIKVGEENEDYNFRASVLKKYAASVLHLLVDVSPEGRGWEQVVYALAAGISMVFATVVAFYAQQIYGNFTFPVFVALVVGYMFKDRIKEVGRQMFASRLESRLYDRRIDIRSQDKKVKLGVLREKVHFVSERDIPKPVMRARNKDLYDDLDNDGQGETVICYTKDIVLHARAFKKVFGGLPRVTGINDIMRYDIRAYLNKMGEPTQERMVLQDGELQSVTTHRVYYLNFISRYRAIHPRKEKLHTRLRLVLNRYGIKRAEDVEV